MSPGSLPQAVRRPPSSRLRIAASGGRRDDLVPLALGEPTWPLPEAATRTLAAIGHCGYGAHDGEPALRRAIAAYEGVGPESVLVTCGAQGALFAVSLAFLGRDDVALVPDPGFPAYRALVELAGARCALYPLDAERGFALDADALLAALARTPRTKLVVVNHPANPTGGGAAATDLARVAHACRRRGTLLVADEVYRELHFGPSPPSLRALTDGGLAVGSLSKAWSAPGLRVGWLAGDPALIAACRGVHALMVTSAAGPSQAAATALVEGREHALSAARRALRRRWRALAEVWHETTGRRPAPPAGGIYHWFSTGGDDRAFCRRARDAGVALVPGSVFGVRGRGYARLSFGARPHAIRRGIRRLAPLLATP